MRSRIQPGDGDPRHGTVNGYTNLTCRCPDCRAAQTRAANEWVHRTGRHREWAVYVAEKRAKAEARDSHGTESRYVHLKCRCDACKAASADARRKRRAGAPRKSSGQA